MVRIQKILAPVLAGLLCAAAMPVSAAGEETEKQYILPLYDDFVPVSEDEICVTIPKNRNVYVEITQHSPERANLMLYSITLKTENDPKFYFPVNPGDYTIKIGMSPAADGIASMTASTDITVENADYAGGEYASSLVLCNVRFTQAAADTPLSAPVVQSGGKFVIKNKLQYANSMTFEGYSRLTGDYTGDGQIDLSDAIGAMTEFNLRYVAMMEEGLCDEETLAASDTDGDGKLTLNDSIAIMTYCNYLMMEMQPDWYDITPQTAE